MKKWSAVFPGQGSQQVGMGKFLFDNFDIAKHRFEEASDTLSLDFKKLCFEGPESDLALTANTQPALLLVSTVCYEVLSSLVKFEPVASSGHSIGEYAATVTAGSLSFSDAIKAVRLRGEAMQSAVPIGKGGMLAVMGLTQEQTLTLCQWAQEKSGLSPVEAANFNAPGQIVISGSQELIDWLQSNMDKTIFNPEPKKLRFIPLKVSAPFHCSMMKPAEDKMREVLTAMSFSDANTPVIQNVTAQPVTKADELRENLIRQVSSSVRWVECVEQLIKSGSNAAVEFGSGKVLNGLIKKIDSEQLTTFNMNSLEELQELEQHFN